MSKKIYKGYELIKAIAEGEIKDGSRFIICGYKQIIKYNNGILYYVNDNFDEINSRVIISYTFELIEDETIDIESIDELLVEQLKNREHTNADIYMLAKRQNELVQAVKQLNKEIKELKSLDIEISEKEINEALKRARNKEYCQVCGVELTEENKYMKNMCYDCKYGEE